MKYIFEGFDSLSENAKKIFTFIWRLTFDIKKNKFILEAALFYIKRKGSLDPCLSKNSLKIKKDTLT